MSKHVMRTVTTMSPSNVSNFFFFFVVKVHLIQLFIFRDAPSCGNKELLAHGYYPNLPIEDENACDISRNIWNISW